MFNLKPKSTISMLPKISNFYVNIGTNQNIATGVMYNLFTVGNKNSFMSSMKGSHIFLTSLYNLSDLKYSPSLQFSSSFSLRKEQRH